MAYREFDPSAMEDYQKQTVKLLKEQQSMANSQKTALQTAKDIAIAQKDVEEKKKDAKIWSETEKRMVDDTATQELAKQKIAELETKISEYTSQIDALDAAIKELDNAMEETKKFIDTIIDQVGAADGNSAKEMQKVIDDINAYKTRMKEMYNRIDDMIPKFGYNPQNTNYKENFANAVDDFGDSTIVRNIPTIPSSYIYNVDDIRETGKLNERILNAIFKWDQVSESQKTELMKVLNNISVNADIKSLEGFVNAGYTVDGEFNHTYIKMLSSSFSSVVNKFYNETIEKIKTELFEVGRRIGTLSNGMNNKILYASVLNQVSKKFLYFQSSTPFSSKLGTQEPWVTLNKEQIYGFNSIRIGSKYGNGYANVLEPSSDIAKTINNLAVAMGMKNGESLWGAVAPVAAGFIFDLTTNDAPFLLTGITTAADLAQAINDYTNGTGEKFEKGALVKIQALYDQISGGGVLSVDQDGRVTSLNLYPQVNGPGSIREMMEWYNSEHPDNQVTEKNIWDNMQAAPFISDKDANQLEKDGKTNPYYTYENIRDEWYNYKENEKDKDY